MRVEGGKKLRRQLSSLKGDARKHIVKAIAAGTNEGVRVARVLAPEKTGRTKQEIHAEFRDDGMTGIVEVIDPGADRADKDRAYSIEHGRKAGDHGTTPGSHHVHRTREYLAKKNKNRVKRAMRMAIKEAAGRG